MFAAIEIMDIASGTTSTVFETDLHVEAPNWTRDGQSLIVNADGRLYTLPLDAPELQVIDTGDHRLCNNDHGLSPSGDLLAISDRTGTDGSCIYTLPAGGGTPRRVTDLVPSWWHGWSPDGALLTYTCVRAGPGGKDRQFGIATIPVAGGAETVLIRSPHHYDGPDYTPDGAWIWFNSDRGGDMALWRMRADGSDPQQMTFDDTVDWFPHPSPDGRHVCYIAFPPGTEGHPPGREIQLRLMPAQGGPWRALAGVYGGQGTLNVPCWAPDSRRFAYVRYSRST